MVDRSCWAEVDLGAIKDNVKALSSLLSPGSSICAVVKADGYGHGAVQVARACLDAGASFLGVALVEEGVALRKAGFTEPILMLGYTGAEGARRAVGWGLSLTVVSLDNARVLAAEAQSQGRVAGLHLKVDTGMGRLGVSPSEAAEVALAIAAMPAARLEGLWSHFADADSVDESFAALQLERYREVLKSLDSAADTHAGLRGIVRHMARHMANSAGLLYHPDAHFDMTRPGIALYGLRASADRAPLTALTPAMTLSARVSQVRLLPAGDSVGYGRTFYAKRESRIATLPLGYADGVSRALSNRGSVGFDSRRAPIVGRICMDQLMVDVTDLPDVQPGSVATIFGRGGPSIAEVADQLGTIDYEVVCAVSARVPRVYVDNGGSNG
ncbi:MAG: alanine racemase [Spirochaetales bacterium]|nr:alanine racemase [Spirochaetales bacterium]